MTIKSTLGLALGLGFATIAGAQGDPCATWDKLDNRAKDEAITNHTLYRDLVKAQNYEEAFPMWQKVYNVAPAADGQRSTHYADGRAIYLAKFNAATDSTEKQKYSDMVMKLYEEHHKCYPKESAALYTNEVYNMFYVLKRPYEEEYDVLMRALELTGDDADFRLLTPLGYVTSYQYTSKNISDKEARRLIEVARGIAQLHKEKNDAQEYADAIVAHDAAVKGIEPYVFDCDYFMPEFEADYAALTSAATADEDGLADREDLVRRMLGANCARAEVALVGKVDAEISMIRKRIYEENNPMSVAKNMYESGDVDGALAKYEEVAGTADNQLKGSIYLQMAGIYRVDKRNFSQARNYARKAASTRPGWGKPYILIGDLYAASSSSCSTDPFQQRVVILAAIDEYARAKSDPGTAGEAQNRINKYSGSTPSAEMMFQRGLKPGASASTGCWVGETVTLR